MNKYKFFNGLGFVSVILLIVSMSIVVMVNDQNGYTKYYNASGLSNQTGISTFEAMLNYESLIDGVKIGGEEIALATYEASDHTVAVFSKIRFIYQNCYYLAFLSALCLGIAIFFVRKVRRYQFFMWGGIGVFVVNAFVPLVVFGFKPELFMNLVSVMTEDASALFYDDLIMQAIIPSQWVVRNLFMLERNLFLGAVISILIYFMLIRSARPHRF